MRVSSLGLYRKKCRNKGQIWRKLRSTVTNTTDLKGGSASEPRDPLSHVNYSILGKRQQVFTTTTPAVLILPKSSAGEIFHSDIKTISQTKRKKNISQNDLLWQQMQKNPGHEPRFGCHLSQRGLWCFRGHLCELAQSLPVQAIFSTHISHHLLKSPWQ